MNDADLRRLVAEVTREVSRELDRGRQGGGPPADRAAVAASSRREGGSRAVVTTTGKNHRGIVAKIAQAIADAGGDIVDISQTLVSDYFTMIIMVDVSALAVSFAEFKSRLERSVDALGAKCVVMHEEVVDALQRI